MVFFLILGMNFDLETRKLLNIFKKLYIRSNIRNIFEN